MWQTDWAEANPVAGRPGVRSELPASEIESVYLLSWAEHCVECAVPACYQTCPLYVARRDRKCARFENGIVPNSQYPGLFRYGAEIRFRRWGKLEAQLGFGTVTPAVIKAIDRLDRAALKWLRPLSSGLRWLSPYYRLNGGYAVGREKLLRRITNKRVEDFDEFVMEVWNLEDRNVRLVIEAVQDRPRFRESVVLRPGRTLHRIPAESINIDLHGVAGFIRVFPDQDATAHLVFSWLDLVRYTRRSDAMGARESFNSSQTAAQADQEKIKCVIWDLDNTVWDGILAEQEAEMVRPRPNVLEVVRQLDERGILQSIASKNDHEHAWGALKRLGVADLFLYPAINWQPKSVNIRGIIADLNIGADACAFIDDSPFERAEVESQVAGIRTYSDVEVSSLLQRPEFDVPLTEEARRRRSSYVAETERKREHAAYVGDYENFLKSCEMRAEVFVPSSREHKERCLELLNRSNQLNLTTRRYSWETLVDLLDDPSVLSVCTACHDRFGDYGIVGFASLRTSGEKLVLEDFVLSCRVARKKLENAWFDWLRDRARSAGFIRVEAPFIPTTRNGVLREALLEAGLVESSRDRGESLFSLNCLQDAANDHVVAVLDRVADAFPFVARGVTIDAAS